MLGQLERHAKKDLELSLKETQQCGNGGRGLWRGCLRSLISWDSYSSDGLRYEVPSCHLSMGEMVSWAFYSIDSLKISFVFLSITDKMSFLKQAT